MASEDGGRKYWGCAGGTRLVGKAAHRSTTSPFSFSMFRAGKMYVVHCSIQLIRWLKSQELVWSD